MRKIYFLLLTVFFFFSGFISSAQVNSYIFVQSSGTYTPVSGGTVVHASGWDDNVSNVALPFSFTFSGTVYNAVNVNSNGYLTFGATAPGTTNYTPISSTAGYGGVVSAFARDLISNATTVERATIGSAPNRQFVVQWNNARRYSGGAIAGDVLNFQIVLNETTNTVQIIYGTCTATSTTSLTAQVGLRGTTNADFNNRTTTTNWSATTAGGTNAATCTSTNAIMPASGLTYSWSIPPPCVAPPGGGTTESSVASACAATPFTLTVTGASFGVGISYAWETSPDGLAPWTATGVTTASYTVANQTTPTYYRRKITCSAQDAYSSVLLVGQNAPTSCYCTVVFTNNIEPITLVNFSNINNATSATLNGTPAQEDFTSIVGNVGKGLSYPIRVKGNTDGGFTTYIDVYIDFNQDGDFGDLGESFFVGTIFGSTGLDAIEATTNILIPPTALDGLTRMRVIKKFNVSAPACQNGTGYGQAEDYTLSITTPPCIPPSGLTITVLTPNTATLSWTASASNPATGYQWEVRTSGAGGSGAAGLVLNGNVGAGVTTASAAPLTPNTAYSYYVRSNCGGIFSDWAGPFAFATPCNPIGVPFTETFASFATTFPPTCWTSSDAILLTGNFSSAYGAGTGSAKFDFYNADAGVNLDLVSPLFNAVPANHRLVFDHAYATFFGENDQLEISYSTDGGITYTTLVTYDGGTGGELNTGGSSLGAYTPSADQWAEKAVDLPAGTNRLRFRGISAFGNNLYLDNITVEPTPSCLPPTGLIAALPISPTTVLVSFNSPGNAFIVEYGAPGFTPGTTNTPGVGGTLVFGTSSPITVGGLTAATTYDFYVRRICIPGVDFSTNKKTTAATLCAATNIPYLQNFETATPLVGFPTCTSTEDVNGNSGPTPNGGGGRWITNSIAQTFVSPSKSMWYIYDLGNPARGGDDWFYLQGLNLTAGVSYRVKAYYKGSDAPTWFEKFEIKYGTQAYSASMTNLIYSNPGTTTAVANPFDSLVADFTPSASGVYYIGFHNISDPDQAFLFIDDISVKISPKVDVGVTNITLPSLNCPTSGVFVQATIRNYNTTIQNFATYPVTVTATITGAVTSTLTATLNAGTLAPGASMDIYLSPSQNFTVAGIYNITTATSSPDDPETGNDAYVTSINVNPNPPAPVITPAASQVCIGGSVLLNTQFTNPPPPPVTLPAAASGAITINVPDGSAAGITHTIPVNSVPAGATVTGISVSIIDLTHTYVSDMVINLKAPNGKILNLFNGNGGNGDNITNAVISSTGVNSLSGSLAPFTGTWIPDAATGVGPNGYISDVNSFSGLYSVGNGNWTLALEDLFGIDLGVLKSWSITITYQMANPAVTWTPVSGLFTNAAGTTAYTGTDAFSVYSKPAATGTYTYTATATTSAGCTATGTATVTVNPYPVLTIGSIPDTVCISDPILQLPASPVGGNWTGVGVSGNTFVPGATAVGTYTLTYTYTSASGCTSTATKRIAVKDCPERIILLRDNAVLLYPNPNNGLFNIRINSVLYSYLGMRVYTNSGILVRTQQFSGLTYGRVIPVDLTNLPGGSYIVKFYYDDGIRTSEKAFKVIIGLP
ncbi:MAG: GEVED domain-containing protein [Bacteroidota bacterium]